MYLAKVREMLTTLLDYWYLYSAIKSLAYTVKFDRLRFCWIKLLVDEGSSVKTGKYMYPAVQYKVFKVILCLKNRVDYCFPFQLLDM